MVRVSLRVCPCFFAVVVGVAPPVAIPPVVRPVGLPTAASSANIGSYAGSATAPMPSVGATSNLASGLRGTSLAATVNGVDQAVAETDAWRTMEPQSSADRPLTGNLGYPDVRHIPDATVPAPSWTTPLAMLLLATASAVGVSLWWRGRTAALERKQLATEMIAFESASSKFAVAGHAGEFCFAGEAFASRQAITARRVAGVCLPLTEKWDPAGLGNTDAKMERYTAVEIKHGRIAMIATMGYFLPEIFRFPGCEKFSNGLGALSDLPLEGWVQLVALIGAHEVFIKPREGGMGAYDFGLGTELLDGIPEEELERRQTVERNNGRLAMVAIIGLMWQDGTFGMTPVAMHSKTGMWGPPLDFIVKDIGICGNGSLCAAPSHYASRGVQRGSLATRKATAALTPEEMRLQGRQRSANLGPRPQGAVEAGAIGRAKAQESAVGIYEAIWEDEAAKLTEEVRMSPSLPFLKYPTQLEGWVGGEKGFDPLAVTDALPVYVVREAELKHGRIAMLATVGWITTDLGFRFPGEQFQVSTLQAHDALVAGGIMGPFLGAILAAETYGAWLLYQGVFSMINRDAGDYFVGKGFLPKDKDKADEMRLKELENGRLAMLAFSGIVTQAQATGGVWPFL